MSVILLTTTWFISTTMATLLSQAHEIVGENLYPSALAIDATLGNGHDTLFLAQHVAPNGQVFGFDIQSSAVQATQARIETAGLQENVTLYTVSHALMLETLPAATIGKIQAIMFNLGYLPGADKNIITSTSSTLPALTASLCLLSPKGILSILAYPGHSGGDTETKAVQQWFEQLMPQSYQTSLYLSTHAKPGAPRLYIVKKMPTA